MNIIHYSSILGCYSIEFLFSILILIFFSLIIFVILFKNAIYILNFSLYVNYFFLFFCVVVLVGNYKSCYVTNNNITFFFFLDTLSILFILMVSYIMSLCLIYTCRSLSLSIKPILLCILFTEFFVILCFSVRNLLLFYVFFELILVPMFFLIYCYGSRGRRVFASFLFFLYTFFGSLLLLIGIAFIFDKLFTLSFDDFIYSQLRFKLNFYDQFFLFFLFFIGFAIKIPIIPFHNWLPEAHVEAPTIGSVILAAVLLKLGGYGILRIILPLLHDFVLFIRIVPITFCLISCIYASFICYRHYDIKKIIAYSSIMHMNFSLIGLWSQSKTAIAGSIISMLAHSAVSAGLFFVAGFLYEKFHTRNILYFCHFYKNFNTLYFFIFLFVLANMAVPCTFSFIGELFLFVGVGFDFVLLVILLGFVFLFSSIFGCVLLYRLIYTNNELNHISIINYKKIAELTIFPNFYGNSKEMVISCSELLILFLLLIPTIFLFFFSDKLISFIYIFINAL